MKEERFDDREQKELILIDKPIGLSSFEVIRVLRKRLGVRNPSAGLPPSAGLRRIGRVKMGHAGTLDPLAEGLLIILVWIGR